MRQAKRKKSEPTLRLFVAAYPPTVLVAQWSEHVQRLDLPPHRDTPREQVHLTLQFIGDTPVAKLDETKESIDRATGGLGGFSLAAQELITLPERGPARLVAIETDVPPTLLELQRRLATRLAHNVRRHPSKQFRPHLTLCRFKTPTRIEPLNEPREDEPFAVRELFLMKSVLKPTGAEHGVVHTFPLDSST